MKKLLLIFTLIIYSSLIVKGVETYITLNPANCLNCVSGIYRICKENKISTVQIVIQKEHQNNVSELNKLYEFNKFNKLKLVFSDSLYDKLSKQKYESEFIIIDNNKEIFRQNIKHIVVNDELLAFYSKPVPVDSFCTNYTTKLAGFTVDNPYLIFIGKYYDYSVVDLISRKEKLIALGEDTKLDLYKHLYKDNFEEKYPKIEEMIAETPTYKTKITNIMQWDKEHLMLEGNIKDYEYNEAGDTIFMINRPSVIKYAYKVDKVAGIYTPDQTIPDDFDPWFYYVSDGRFYVQGMNKNNKGFQLLELACNEKTKTLSFKKDTKIERPKHFAERRVSGLEVNTIMIRGNMLCFLRDNKITLLNSGKEIEIPFEHYATAKWNEYEIEDMYEDIQNYYILYVYNSSFHVMRINKNNKPYYDIEVGDLATIEETKIKFYNSGNKLIYQPIKSDCFYIKDVGFTSSF